MNLLGIDVGTSGVKTALLTAHGEMLASSYREYNEQHPEPGYAELDSWKIWEHVKDAIREVTIHPGASEVVALSISSMGEAVVPISKDRKILGHSIMHFDMRGEEFLDSLTPLFENRMLYNINGNTFGNQYTLTKLKWIKTHQPDLYHKTYKFLHWSGFIAFMLGAEPAVDYSLANRTLLFDLKTKEWSDDLLRKAELDREKLPRTVPSGTVIGTISQQMAAELNLPVNTSIVSGAHDQCANAVGCGVIDSGNAVFGMGTFLCITPVFEQPKMAEVMIPHGISTEHHAVPGRYVSFLYNQGGILVKWFRDTFAAAEYKTVQAQGKNIYQVLFAEIPEEPSNLFVLPHFTASGPPNFINNSSGVITGLHLETTRGEILKGIIECANFYLKEIVDDLPETGISIKEYRAVGGGAQSDAWVQLSADIFGRPFVRPVITEAGALGAAIMAGVGSGVYGSYPDGVNAMVKLESTFEPDLQKSRQYQEKFAKYQQLFPVMSDFLHD